MRARRPIDTAWAAVAVVVPVVVTLLSRMGAVDLAYHLRAGDLILATHGIPRADSFTFSVPGTPWLDQQWGAQVVLALAFKVGAWATLKALQAGLTALTFGFVFLACRARGASERTSSLLTIAGFVVGAPALAMRPQLIGLPLAAIALWCIAGRRSHPRRLWAVPVLAAVCANVHGSFTLFPLLAGLAWVEDRWEKTPASRRTLAVGIASGVATLANPLTWHVWAYAYDLSTNPVIRKTINEWAPVSLSLLSGWLMLVSGIAVAAFFARRSRPVPWPTILSLALFFLFAMSAQRAIVWWAMVAPIALAGLQRGGPAREAAPAAREPAAPALAVVGTLLAAVLVLLPWWRGTGPEQQLGDVPFGLTAAVAQDVLPGSRLLVHQPWGSWFEYALPDRPVFVDSRIEIIPAWIWKDYGQVGFAGAGWRSVLARWHVDAIVAKADEWDLIPFLCSDPEWAVAYQDKDGVLFVRASAGGAPVACATP